MTDADDVTSTPRLFGMPSHRVCVPSPACARLGRGLRLRPLPRVLRVEGGWLLRVSAFTGTDALTRTASSDDRPNKRTPCHPPPPPPPASPHLPAGTGLPTDATKLSEPHHGDISWLSPCTGGRLTADVTLSGTRLQRKTPLLPRETIQFTCPGGCNTRDKRAVWDNMPTGLGANRRRRNVATTVSSAGPVRAGVRGAGCACAWTPSIHVLFLTAFRDGRTPSLMPHRFPLPPPPAPTTHRPETRMPPS